MAIRCLLQHLLIWTSIHAAAATSGLTLVEEVASFIPSCAQNCLKTFIRDNGLIEECGTSPTLQCLCSHETATGLGIGEAAVECISGSADFTRSCASGTVNSSVLQEAYHMCDGQDSALPNTHSPLTATFKISTSGSGAVIIVSPTTTTTTSSTMFISSTLVVPPASSSPSSLLTFPGSTMSSTFTTSTTSSFPTTTAQASPTATTVAAQPSSLGKAQIAGISVAVVAGIALAVGVILLARHLRRRQYSTRDDAFSTDEQSSVGGKGWAGGSTGGGSGGMASRFTRIFHISPPILKPQPRVLEPQTPPLPLEYQNIDRNTIGLAISRPRSEVAPKVVSSPASERRASKLLPPRPLKPAKPAKSAKPAKPNLTLNIPSAGAVHPALRPDSSQPPQTDRTSIMTNMTAFADLDTEAAEGGQIWRPPSESQSAGTYYVADRWGNWVLSNNNRQSDIAQVTEAAELDTYTPLTKSPIEKKEEAAAAAARAAAMSTTPTPAVSKPPRAVLQTDPPGPYMSRSSSLYSQASVVHPPGRQNSSTHYRTGSSGRTAPSRSDSKASAGSTTTIQTSSSGGGPFDEDAPLEPELGRVSTLSPVMESPGTPTGRSPVKYPKIPGRLDSATIRMVPPPRRPDFTASPPGQPSPTLGLVLPARSSSIYPLPLNPNRASRLGEGISPSQVAPSSGSGFTPERPSIPRFPNPPPELSRPGQREGPPGNPLRLDTRGLTPNANAFSYASPLSAVSRSSAASSLLAKRLGNERAAALALENNQRSHAGPWRRQGDAPGSAGLLSPSMDGMMSPRPRLPGYGGLPATPTWQPKLTPTRRGDDLYLNVQ